MGIYFFSPMSKFNVALHGGLATPPIRAVHVLEPKWFAAFVFYMMHPVASLGVVFSTILA